ncbi:MAG: class I SAM-dependent methyltransferase [Bacteroidota bacterium]|nr:class I SAM-dependent methyltransferase [Bacteroidota bacterium]MDP3145445.1 class I SAM-dependent methyltransferase [Bacteroidota bacterium]
MENKKKHWENIYQTKELKDVSWYQAKPTTSLEFLEEFNVAKSAKIIDVGGGDSFFVDHLIELGYSDITVLDISETALERAKMRLGEKASAVKWIVADAAKFIPTEKYDFWHDRAAFHFLTEETEIKNYIDTIKNYLNLNGVLVVGTFSETGPTKCSGIEIKQYSEVSISERLSQFFKKIKCVTVDHQTPFNTIQNFIFCSFKKISTSI